MARARGLARLTALVRVATMVAPQPRPGPHAAQHAAHHRHLITTTAIELETKVIRRFHKHGEGPSKSLLLVESGYYSFHIQDTIRDTMLNRHWLVSILTMG